MSSFEAKHLIRRTRHLPLKGKAFGESVAETPPVADAASGGGWRSERRKRQRAGVMIEQAEWQAVAAATEGVTAASL